MSHQVCQAKEHLNIWVGVGLELEYVWSWAKQQQCRAERLVSHLFPLFKKVELQVTCSVNLLQRGNFVIVSVLYLHTCSSSDRTFNLINPWVLLLQSNQCCLLKQSCECWSKDGQTLKKNLVRKMSRIWDCVNWFYCTLDLDCSSVGLALDWGLTSCSSLAFFHTCEYYCFRKGNPSVSECLCLVQAVMGHPFMHFTAYWFLLLWNLFSCLIPFVSNYLVQGLALKILFWWG